MKIKFDINTKQDKMSKDEIKNNNKKKKDSKQIKRNQKNEEFN